MELIMLLSKPMILLIYSTSDTVTLFLDNFLILIKPSGIP